MTRQGIEDVRAGGPDDAVCGVVPTHVARPRDTETLGRLLAGAAERGWSVAVRGGGTAQDWGGRPRTVDLLVDTGALTWIDHDAGDLVVEVGAGTPVAELTATLAKAGQRLSVDPVRAGGTVGGLLATGVCGPRRLRTGTLRNLVIGMTVVRADGVVARSGGRVVKNVAGYDLAKLHTGGYGTLGVIASAAFRLHPLPPALRVLDAPLPSREAATRALAALRRSTVVPAAVELDRAPGGRSHLHVVLEGTSAGVEARADETVRVLGAALAVEGRGTPGDGGTAMARGEGHGGTEDATSSDRAPENGVRVTDRLPDGWGLLPTEGTLIRLSVPPARSAAAAARAAELGDAVGTDLRTTGSARAGALVVAVPPGASAEVIGLLLEGLRSVPEWSATVLRAEPHVHEAGVDLWGEVPGLAVMRAIKDALDPGHRLAPGRFVTDRPDDLREEP
ncbi:FAD-binding oxidoreductase [Nocardiopsis sp. N85]|uniref:FAD-binding oxidoreductase n=1 Tax=Nocardiopsis sp. N85 TaxID=3029400 RepID=UPI00237F8C91|nr:FAD-binding oxidoreductase [Nocardiopsis sp. N85]MDE3720050.1 FAD-binding oxidoreductase [Nocardiopsis sp. N85]